MNTSLSTLFELSGKTRLIVGLMSGTSLDGLDIALCEIKGQDTNTQLCVKHFTCVPYDSDFLNKLRPLFANPLAPLHEVTKANAWIAREHANMLLASLAKWNVLPSEIDILASHGQTIFHAPNSLPLVPVASSALQNTVSASLQIGDGCHLAHITQILTVSDFRQKHIAANGEGAPLVPYADFLLFTSTQENRVLLNIGGIANFTYIPAGCGFNDLLSADTGPGSTLMDTVIRHAKDLRNAGSANTSLPIFDHSYDENGNFAAQGTIDESLLAILTAQAVSLGEASQGKTKSTGQESYHINFILNALQMNDTSALNSFPQSEQAFYNLLATLNMFTATSIASVIGNIITQNSSEHPTLMYISGGGVHNTVLLRNIQQCLPSITVTTAAALGINPDAKEAALFAVLANQTLFGSSDVFNNERGIVSTCFGKISFP